MNIFNLMIDQRKQNQCELRNNHMLQLCIWQILTQTNEEIEQKVVHTKPQYKGHHLLDFPLA